MPLWSLLYPFRVSAWTGWLSPVRPTSDPRKTITLALPSCSLPRRCTLLLLCRLQANLATESSLGRGVPDTGSSCLSGSLKHFLLGLMGSTFPFPIARLGARERGRRETSQHSKPSLKETSLKPQSSSYQALQMENSFGTSCFILSFEAQTETAEKLLKYYYTPVKGHFHVLTLFFHH